jgi:hypothetical protein
MAAAQALLDLAGGTDRPVAIDSLPEFFFVYSGHMYIFDYRFACVHS